MKKITLEFVVFVCGAVVMAYEIIGSRMLALCGVHPSRPGQASLALSC
ncbi:MAG: hypothetical protein R2750_00780 [Bacteroidales bacterium]